MLEVTVILVLPAYGRQSWVHEFIRELEGVRTIPGNFDIVTKLAGFALDLDTIMQEFLKVRAIENTIRSGFWVINDKLVLWRSWFSGGGLGLERNRCEPTEKITQQSDTGEH